MTTGYVTDTGEDRFALLVGGIRADSARAAMTEVRRILGSSARAWPDGENPTQDIPQRDTWIEPEMRAIAGIDGVTSNNPGAGYTGPDDAPWYSARRQLTADDFAKAVILERAFKASYPVFTEVRGDLPVRFQAGTPAHLDLALYAFRERGLAPDILDPIAEAKARQVNACNSAAPGDVVFQLETPASVVMTTTTADGEPRTAADQARTAAWLAGLLVDLPARCPGSAWGVHLCDGDWFHQAMTEPDSALPLVLLASEIVRQWPACPDAPRIEYFHFPFAAAAKPPATAPAWYESLADLKLPAGCGLAAGFVHELLDIRALRALLAVIEKAYGAPVGVAATCGLGRRPRRAQVADAMTKMAELVPA